MQHVFIIGSKGIPANYGGYETFVEKLTENQVSHDIIVPRGMRRGLRRASR